MQNIKRVEIVVEAIEESNVIHILNDIGIEGYTIYRHVGGAGSRGARDSQAFGDKFENIAFVIACQASEIAALTEAIRPVLAKFGGICLVSDAMWLKHNAN